MEQLKKLLPHAMVLLLFVVITFIFFTPVLEGKRLRQSDISHFKGMSKEIVDYRAETGEEALWTNSMFGGMPAYQISMQYSGNLMKYVDKVFKLFTPGPVNMVLLYLIGFYILMCSLKIDYRIAALGAFAFAFSSYFFIILDVGHNTKAHAIGYMAPILGGVIMAYNNKKILGAVITSLFLALQLKANHFQITYYTGLIVLCYLIFVIYERFKEKKISDFINRSLFLGLGVILALGTNIANLWSTYEYSKYTIRGKSELTILNKENKTSGLDKDYVTQWSYGIGETMTLLIPNFKGGGSEQIAASPKLLEDVDPTTRQVVAYAFKYHGDQNYVAGPVYAGAIVIFLAVLGILILDGAIKWGLLVSLILGMTLSWGKNFMWLSDLFLDYFPMYNKFRAVSMMLVIVEFCLPVLGFIVLSKIISNPQFFRDNIKKVYLSLGLTAGICLLFATIPGVFTEFQNTSESRYNDPNLAAQFLSTVDHSQKAQVQSVIDLAFDEVESIRESLLKVDAFRSFALISLAFLVLLLYSKGTLKKNMVIAGLALLIVGDMWMVNKRYIHNKKYKGQYEKWQSKRELKTPYQPTKVDLQIQEDKDPNFRVYNTTARLDQDSRTSYFHKSLGGYHGAKLKRYQELIDMHMYTGNRAIYNMLNTKYFIVQGQNGQPEGRPNPENLGNAWYVSNYKIVANADSEITALSNFDPSQTVIIDKRYENQVEGVSPSKSGTIILESYKPNHLVYKSNAANETVAVFSEIYYDKGWDMYIDGKEQPYFRCNYVLRGAKIPAGEHTIEFKFEPASYHVGNKISLASSILLILFLVGVGFKELKGTKE